MNKRFLFTIATLLVIGIAASVAIFLAKGYRFSPTRGTILGTGILSITSIPDQASVYLDGHLTTATNANINSLPPKTYTVRILKEGFIPWEKKIEVKKELVSEVEATLFRAIPTVYPLTYSGVQNATLSPDGQKLVYVVPISAPENPASIQKKSGVWVWQMSQSQIAFARAAQPVQIALSSPLIDYSQAHLRFSPDSSLVLASFENQHLLLETNRLNDPPRDITAILELTLKSWEEDQRTKDLARLSLIKDLSSRKTASNAATLKWAPDERKFLYSQDGKADFKVVDLESGSSFIIPHASSFNWLPDSEHLILVETGEPAKISIIEFDGSNKSEIYAGSFDPTAVFAWPDSSRLLIISSLPIATASQPNLYGVNLK